MAASRFIDPAKHADYPVVLGDRLSAPPSSLPRLINFNYNHKSKSAARHSSIARSKGKDRYNLTVADSSPNAESTPYSYEGSVDPTQPSEHSLALVFDPDRKAFVLEPISSHLNFNLRSAPGKSKQAVEQYSQLKTLQNEDQGPGDTAEDDGPPDESNPYDFRHFLPKPDGADKPISSNATPDPHSEASKTNSPLTPSTKRPASSVKPKPKPKPNPQTNPLRQKTTAKSTNKETRPAPKPEPKTPAASNEKVDEPKSPSSDTGTSALLSQKPAPSPGSNIIVDGDLIIDMGSPPPSRPAFKVNPAHFSSNNTPSNAGEDEEEMEDLRLPSPAGRSRKSAPTERVEPTQAARGTGEGEGDDELAAEMEAAFEQSALEEEEARSQQHPPGRRAASDDESEVSEEE